MNDLLIRFKTLPWEKKEVNVKQKSITFENKTIRLVLFEAFFDKDLPNERFVRTERFLPDRRVWIAVCQTSRSRDPSALSIRLG